MIRRLAIALLLLMLFPCARGDAAFEHVSLGARPQAMAGAFTTFADDANALQWNPAGLALLSAPQFHLSYLDLYGLVGYSAVSFVTPRRNFGWGLGLVSSGDPEGLYRESELRSGLGIRLWGYGVLGWTLRYLSSEARNGDVPIGGGRGLALDLGVRFQPLQQLWVAAAIPNALAHVRYHREALWRGPETSYAESPLREGRVGIGGEIPGRYPIRVAFEIHEGPAWKLGFESLVGHGLTLRGGIQWGARINRGWAFGFGYASGPFHIDYAYTSGRFGISTSQMSFGWRYGSTDRKRGPEARPSGSTPANDGG